MNVLIFYHIISKTNILLWLDIFLMVHVRDQGMDVQRILQMRSYHLDFFSADSTTNPDSCLTPQLRMATITSTETSSTLDLN